MILRLLNRLIDALLPYDARMERRWDGRGLPRRARRKAQP